MNTPVGSDTSSAVSVDGSPVIVLASNCFPGSDSADASFKGEPLSLIKSGRPSGLGVFVPWEPDDVTGGDKSSPEWNGVPTRVRNWYTSEAESRNRWS